MILSGPAPWGTMRLVFRIIGTWLIGLACVLIVIDGTKSLAVNALVMTPLAETWAGISPESIDAVRSFLGTRFFSGVLLQGFDALLTVPTFSVAGVPGILFALLGRSRRQRRFIRQDQF